MSAIQFILTTGLLGAAGCAVFMSRRPPNSPVGQDTQLVYRYDTAPPQKRFNLKDALIGGVLGTLAGYAASEIEDRTGIIFNATGDYKAPNVFHASTDYKTPYGADIGSRLMADLQRDFGLTGPQAAGIVGNLDHESGGFAHMQEINPTVAGSRGGYGYAQWTGPRRRNFEAWAAGQGMDASSYAANYGFLRHELTNTSEGRVIARLQRTNTVDDATVVFMNGFLRPGIKHTASRQRRARRYAGSV